MGTWPNLESNNISDEVSLVVLRKIAAKSTFRLAGMVWADNKEID